MIFNRLKKINSLLTQKEKTKGIILLLMIMIMGFFDVLGIASIMPFMAVLTNPELIQTNPIINNFPTYIMRLIRP